MPVLGLPRELAWMPLQRGSQSDMSGLHVPSTLLNGDQEDPRSPEFCSAVLGAAGRAAPALPQGHLRVRELFTVEGSSPSAPCDRGFHTDYLHGHREVARVRFGD